MKLLFALMSRVRLVHTDPWEAPTFQIAKIGQYSYFLHKVKEGVGEYMVYDGDDSLTFKEQGNYSTVPCPGKQP
jgi:hypothetical protein